MFIAPEAERQEGWRVALDSRQEPQPEVIVVRADPGWRVLVLGASAALVVGVLLGGMAVRMAMLQADQTSPASQPPPTQIALITSAPAGTAPFTPTATPIALVSPSVTVTPSRTPTATAPAVRRSPSPLPTPPPLILVTARSLNVRVGPGVEHAILGYAVRGQRFRLTGATPTGDWVRVDFNGLAGWMSAQWVQMEKGSGWKTDEMESGWPEAVQDLKGWAEFGAGHEPARR